ncbi:hypothetical protein D9M71_805930 [compost metagenome]
MSAWLAYSESVDRRTYAKHSVLALFQPLRSVGGAGVSDGAHPGDHSVVFQRWQLSQLSIGWLVIALVSAGV